jgi:hypothetical protein
MVTSASNPTPMAGNPMLLSLVNTFCAAFSSSLPAIRSRSADVKAMES